MQQKREPCPYCKELIVEGAAKCRFCGEWLERNQVPQPEEPSAVQQPPPHEEAPPVEAPGPQAPEAAVPPSRFAAAEDPGEVAIAVASIPELNAASRHMAVGNVEGYGGFAALAGAYAIYVVLRAGLMPLTSGLWVLAATGAILVVGGVAVSGRKPYWAVITGIALLAAGVEAFVLLMLWASPGISHSVRAVLIGGPLYLAWQMFRNVGPLRRAPREKPAEGAVKAVERMKHYLLLHSFYGSRDVIIFAGHTTLDATECKGGLIGDVFVLADGGDRLSFVPRGEASIRPRRSIRGHELLAQAAIGGYVQEIRIPEASYERFEAWKAAEPVVTQ